MLDRQVSDVDADKKPAKIDAPLPPVKVPMLVEPRRIECMMDVLMDVVGNKPLPGTLCLDAAVEPGKSEAPPPRLVEHPLVKEWQWIEDVMDECYPSFIQASPDEFRRLSALGDISLDIGIRIAMDVDARQSAERADILGSIAHRLASISDEDTPETWLASLDELDRRRRALYQALLAGDMAAADAFSWAKLSGMQKENKSTDEGRTKEEQNVIGNGGWRARLRAAFRWAQRRFGEVHRQT